MRPRGYTLVELMVTLALLALLLKLAAPQFGLWMRNAQVRTAADALNNGLRVAQTEAVRRSRQTVFMLADGSACATSTAAATGSSSWIVRTVPLTTAEAAEVVQCGLLADLAAAVRIDGPALLCFNSAGRQAANPSPGTAGTCTLDPGGTSRYDVTAPGSDRPLRVLVSLGGQVRQCDPARTLSATVPDGCPQ